MKFFQNREFRVKVVRTPKNEFAPDEVLEEQQPLIDPELVGAVAKDVISHAVSTLFQAFVAYKVIDTVCKIVVKKA